MSSTPTPMGEFVPFLRMPLPVTVTSKRDEEGSGVSASNFTDVSCAVTEPVGHSRRAGAGAGAGTGTGSWNVSGA
jgi:hypothetical protein